MAWHREPGSFKDPSGFVFVSDGIVYRQVNQNFADGYQQLMDTGLYAELSRDRLLVSHEEVDLRLPDGPPAYKVLKPERIPFVSYPYEWCFSQLKEAALLTLEVQRRALARGLTLRDASAFNVQFLEGRPIFIDSLSFGPHDAARPWTAYRQFCEHFVAPLALIAFDHPSLGQLSRVHLDGIPLDLATRLLPIKSRMRAGLVVHAHMHAKSLTAGRAQQTETRRPPEHRRMGAAAMLGLVESLTRTVERLSWRPPDTLWSTYTDHSSYSASAHERKQRIVAEWLASIAARQRINTLWDLGANTGTYSRIAAEQTSALVVSLDGDHACVERHVRACRARNEQRVLPLLQDFANPSPAIGWRHSERASLEQRGPADAALALALVHHLAIGGNIPLRLIANFFRALCVYLVVEFVPKDDAQIQRMLACREDVFAEYSKDHFEAAFGSCFDVLQATPVESTGRTLYLMKRR
jgi:hypothetical protein